MDDKKIIYTFVDENGVEYEIRDRRIDEGSFNIDVDLSEYATKEFVNEKLAEIKQCDCEPVDLAPLEGRIAALENKPEHECDLSGYALKSEIPTNYLTEADLEGYLKVGDNHDVSLEGYATESYVNSAIAGLENYDDTELSGRVNALEAIDHSVFLTEHQSLAGYVKKEEYDELLEKFNRVSSLVDYLFANRNETTEADIVEVIEHEDGTVEEVPLNVEFVNESGQPEEIIYAYED